VPHLLIREQMGTRFRTAQENLVKIQDPAYFERVITVGESWIHHYDPQLETRLQKQEPRR